MATVKYKIHEVAKDFGKQSKAILELIAPYAEEEKKYTSALDDKELSIIFELMTQQNAVASLEDYFATASEPKEEAAPAEQAEEAPKAEEKAEEKPAAKPAQPEVAKKPAEKPAEKPARPAAPQGGKKPAPPQGGAQQPQKKQKGYPALFAITRKGR